MVEGARLEIVWAFTRLGGSNPLASATFFTKMRQKAGCRISLTLDANPLASATFFTKMRQKAGCRISLTLDANPLASATIYPR